MPKLTYDKDNFFLNGEKLQIISGAMHYFRIVPEYWEDRLKKLKLLGCNSVETYIPWNMHEQKKGEFDFSGILDLIRYIELATELGLMVILRPGPFICAEWDFGGLPAWLLKDRSIRLRCYNETYLQHLEPYITKILKMIEPYLLSNNGSVIMLQVENEYGAYGNDKKYLNFLTDIYTKYCPDTLLFTADQPDPHMINGARIDDVLVTGNFGSRAPERFTKLRKIQPNAPLFCMEFWCGWFDHWGSKHNVRSPKTAAVSLDEILAMGGSVNLYMFHGGTNFGFTSGANCHDGKKYEPTTTSYDYDALLSESGEITQKYLACRKVIGKYVDLPQMSDIKKELAQENLYIPNIAVTEVAPLLENLQKLSTPTLSSHTMTMEETGQNFGYILYRTVIEQPLTDATLWIQDLRDRAQIFIDGEYINTIYRVDKEQIITFSTIKKDSVLEIFVENMGRVNYGPYMLDPKGITQGVQINKQYHFGWEMYNLPMDNLDQLSYIPEDSYSGKNEPAFYKAIVTIDKPKDTFLNMDGWGKGIVFVNGFNLGRYWHIGPQKTLYVPKPLLRKGDNEIIVFDMEQHNANKISLESKPNLGKINPISKFIMNQILSKI